MAVSNKDSLKTLIIKQNSQIKQLSKRLQKVEEALESRDSFSAAIPEEKEEPKIEESSTKTENPTSLFKVFGIVGVIMIILGMVYFYKYAVDNGWIGISGRIVLGILASLALVAAGIYLFFKKYHNFSQLIISAGLGVLYFTIFATYHFRQYRDALGMDLIPNTVLLLLIMLGGTILGMRLGTKYVVYGSLLLGYVAAFLSGITGNTIQILIFVLLMNIVSLIVAKISSWYIGLPSITLTYIAYSIWYFSNLFQFSRTTVVNFDAILIPFGFLLAYYAIFTLISLIQSSDKSAKHSMGISVVNTVALAGFGLGIINQFYPEFNGLYLMLVAGLSILVGIFFKNLKLKNMFDVYFVITLALVAIAIPVQFDKTIVTVLWSLMALGLAYAGLKIEDKRLLTVGYAGFIIPVIRVLTIDLWNLHGIERWLSVGACLAGLIAMQILVIKKYSSEKAHEDVGFNAYSAAGIIIGAVWLAKEIFDMDISSGSTQVVLSIIWALYAIALIIYGAVRKVKIFTWFGIIMFGIVVAKILIVDISSLQNIMRVIALIGVGLLALIGSFVFVKNREKLNKFI